MAFDFYFTGVSAKSEVAQYLLSRNACVLLSQLNDRSEILKWINLFKESPEKKCKLFIDSGAFSAWTRNKLIDVDEYIDFINTNHEYFDACASVDSIPGEPRSARIATKEEVEQSAEKTWQNFLYMRSKMKNPDILIYTFHCGEPVRFLKRALEYSDEFGPIKYIAFGGLVGKSESVIKPFLEEAFNLVKRSSNPKIKIHAFGMTRLKYLENYPFTSADSTSWLQTANYGSIIIGSKTVCISDRKHLDDDNLFNKNPALKESVQKIAEEAGFSLEELSSDSSKRLMFNVKQCLYWAENFNPTYNNFSKVSLF